MERPPASAPALSRGVIHVWSARLSQPASVLSSFLPTLSPDERDRAARYEQEEARVRFVMARGLLRAILSDYLEIPAARIRFSYEPAGKPELSRRQPTRTLTFNLARSGDHAVVAVGVGRRLGVDVEAIRPVAHTAALLESVCSPGERTAIAIAPPAARDELLLSCWTCKEAYAKAHGDVAAHPPAAVEVELRPDGRVQFLKVDGSEREAAHWRVERLRPAPGYVGALVVEGYDWVLAEMNAFA